MRSDIRNKIDENSFNCDRKASKRKNQLFCDDEKVSAKSRKYGSNINTCIQLFHKNISVGPIYICSCCRQTWFKQSVSETKSLSKEQKKIFITHNIC